MCGIERKCLKCGEWKSPANFRRKVIRGIYFDKLCKACRGWARVAAVMPVGARYGVAG